MADLASRFADEEYKNWLKVGQALLCLRDGLYSFTDSVSSKFQQDLLQKFAVGNQSCTQCKAKDVEYMSAPPHWKLKTNCPVQLCDKFLVEIAGHHAHQKSKQSVYWANADPRKWPTEHWEIAKVYMGKGQKTNKGPANTDASNLLIFVQNCKSFNIPPAGIKKIQKVISCRNAIMHSSTLHLGESDMKDYLRQMMDVLEDSDELRQNQNAKEAVQNIREIEQMTIDLGADINDWKDKELFLLRERMLAVEERIDDLEEGTNKGPDKDEIRAMFESFLQNNKDLQGALSPDLDKAFGVLDRRVTDVESKVHQLATEMKTSGSTRGASNSSSGFDVSENYKENLNFYSQKNKVTDVKYDKSPESGKWWCTVTYDGEKYMSESSYSKSGVAEQNAAYQVLKKRGYLAVNVPTRDSVRETGGATSTSQSSTAHLPAKSPTVTSSPQAPTARLTAKSPTGKAKSNPDPASLLGMQLVRTETMALKTTVQWSQNLGHRMKEVYHKYLYQTGDGREVPVYVHTDKGQPEELMVDADMQYGICEGCIYLVYHDKHKYKPFQHRFNNSVHEGLHFGGITIDFHSIYGKLLVSPEKSELDQLLREMGFHQSAVELKQQDNHKFKAILKVKVTHCISLEESVQGKKTAEQQVAGMILDIILGKDVVRPTDKSNKETLYAHCGRASLKKANFFTCEDWGKHQFYWGYAAMEHLGHSLREVCVIGKESENESETVTSAAETMLKVIEGVKLREVLGNPHDHELVCSGTSEAMGISQDRVPVNDGNSEAMGNSQDHVLGTSNTVISSPPSIKSSSLSASNSSPTQQSSIVENNGPILNPTSGQSYVVCLNEYCQKKGLRLPEYDTNERTSKVREYKGRVKNFKIKVNSACGESVKKKKECEKDVACHSLVKVFGRENPDRNTSKNQLQEICVKIDSENIPAYSVSGGSCEVMFRYDPEGENWFTDKKSAKNDVAKKLLSLLEEVA